MTNHALLDQIFPGRVVKRFFSAHVGETLSTTQVTKARGKNPEIWDDRADTIHHLCRLLERGEIKEVGVHDREGGGRDTLWQYGEQVILMLEPGKTTIPNPLRSRTEVWCQGTRLRLTDGREMEEAPYAQAEAPNCVYIGMGAESLTLWPDVAAPVEIVVRGFRNA